MNSNNLELALIYKQSGKKYTFSQEVLDKYVNQETIARIKAELLKEIAKL